MGTTTIHPEESTPLPWALQHERRALALVRSSGTPLVLWAHREDRHLVTMYGTLEANHIMEQFAAPPYRFEFEHKITDRPALVARYCRNLDRFARFPRKRGELPDRNR